MRKNNDFGLLILRITIGFLMLLHGISKFKGGLDFISGMLVEKGLPGFFAYGVIIGEILAPILIIIGFRTRIAALILAFNCLVAVLMAHSQDILKISDHGGWELDLLGLYFFTAIALFFTGGGKFAASKSNKWD
ncbi:putative oxidoreductase [Flavobacterium sp. CF108]|uniref:DoxX family protein n=1 Tax=unclassified Flavobacterium TaxID=196869 RepID=UPI0008D22C47|nr:MULTISPECIES: DoxX family protein [unclassified Flavobacterium]SEO69773.1 putative oxidoreductase [Flavobacterium sp. fv08]SHH90591.1 putative oxidoreductase [Flavobacterium sp. CF108]